MILVKWIELVKSYTRKLINKMEKSLNMNG